MQVQPLRDRVLVQRHEAEKVSKGGIIIPPMAQDKSLRGTVVAIGDGKRTESGLLLPLVVKPGDEILFQKYGGTEVTVNEHEYVLIHEDDIQAILHEIDVSAIGRALEESGTETPSVEQDPA